MIYLLDIDKYILPNKILTSIKILDISSIDILSNKLTNNRIMKKIKD
jgi:hypothetical protein